MCRKAKIDEGVGKLGEAVLPDIAKMVRLAFHDCLKDENGNGCNGCLNFKGMGTESPGVDHNGCVFNKQCDRESHPQTTDNNNLLWVAQVLEQVYIDSELPIPEGLRGNNILTGISDRNLTTSLKGNGKSRSDL